MKFDIPEELMPVRNILVVQFAMLAVVTAVLWVDGEPVGTSFITGASVVSIGLWWFLMRMPNYRDQESPLESVQE